jgi:hypothetical protein
MSFSISPIGLTFKIHLRDRIRSNAGRIGEV